MKLFHTENGKEVVYVQLQDIMELGHRDMPIPAIIFTKIFASRDRLLVDNTNRFNWVEFKEDNVIKFFREVDFIIDYGEYRDLTDEQLEKEAKKIVLKANEIAERSALHASTAEILVCE